MKTVLKVGFVLSLSVILIFSNIATAQEKDLSSELQVFRITQSEKDETAVRATEITPGDTIEYRLTYTNNLSGAITNLQPVLPIPQGMQYIGTARPKLNKVSLDSTGTTFQSLPVIRTITLASGEQQDREVPASEYRRLRWMVETLSGQESITLTARLKVLGTNTL